MRNVELNSTSVYAALLAGAPAENKGKKRRKLNAAITSN